MQFDLQKIKHLFEQKPEFAQGTEGNLDYLVIGRKNGVQVSIKGTGMLGHGKDMEGHKVKAFVFMLRVRASYYKQTGNVVSVVNQNSLTKVWPLKWERANEVRASFHAAMPIMMEHVDDFRSKFENYEQLVQMILADFPTQDLIHTVEEIAKFLQYVFEQEWAMITQVHEEDKPKNKPENKVLDFNAMKEKLKDKPKKVDDTQKQTEVFKQTVMALTDTDDDPPTPSAA